MRFGGFAALATLAVWVGPGALGSALAQEPSDEDVAAARALFAEGRTLAEGGEWQTAADRFRRALALRPAPAIRYNLAAALAQLGRLVEAAEQLRAAVREASSRDAARAPSEELLGEIEPRIGRLTIRLQGEGRGTQVTLDGRLVSLARIGVATPVDPGSHVIVVRQGNLEATRQVNLPDGGSAEVVVPVPTGRPPVSGPGVLPGPRESPRAVVPPPDRVARDEVQAQPAGGVATTGSTRTEEPTPSRSIFKKWWFWTVVGVVVVGGVVVAAAGGGGRERPIDGSAGLVELP